MLQITNFIFLVEYFNPQHMYVNRIFLDICANIYSVFRYDAFLRIPSIHFLLTCTNLKTFRNITFDMKIQSLTNGDCVQITPDETSIHKNWYSKTVDTISKERCRYKKYEICQISLLNIYKSQEVRS